MADLVGATGALTIATGGAEGPGEVELRRGTYIAWSKEPLAKGIAVLVTGTRGVRTVTVEPFDI